MSFFILTFGQLFWIFSINFTEQYYSGTVFFFEKKKKISNKNINALFPYPFLSTLLMSTKKTYIFYYDSCSRLEKNLNSAQSGSALETRKLIIKCGKNSPDNTSFETSRIHPCIHYRMVIKLRSGGLFRSCKFFAIQFHE